MAHKFYSQQYTPPNFKGRYKIILLMYQNLHTAINTFLKMKADIFLVYLTHALVHYAKQFSIPCHKNREKLTVLHQKCTNPTFHVQAHAPSYFFCILKLTKLCRFSRFWFFGSFDYTNSQAISKKDFAHRIFFFV